MVFTTVPFIIFFAVVFFSYYVLPNRFRWWLLVAASMFFYAYMTPYYLIFLGVTVAITYLGAVAIDNNLRRQKAWIAAKGTMLSRETKKAYKSSMERKRNYMITAVAIAVIGMLVAFKYLDFLFFNVNWLGGALGFDFKLSCFHFILPIGLSFYVFQSLGYCIDVGREVVVAERNFFKHALFVSYFPQILQGPIGDYGRLAPQFFGRHNFDYDQVVLALQRVAWGFFKKLVIANVIAQRIDPTWHNAAQHHGILVWMTILFLYSIQLYADFSGYMDIACGCSEMLGIKLDENFNCPYFSKSVSEFWRRWHITLSEWFKNYLFYPVLRSNWNTSLRKKFANKYFASAIPTSVALAIVWSATGLWHGASWGYVAWGVYYGIFMILAIVLAPLYDVVHKKWPRLVVSRGYVLFQMIRTFVIVMIGYSIFKPASLHSTWAIWKQIFLLCPDGLMAHLHHVHYFLRTDTVIWIIFLVVVDLVHYNYGLGAIRGRIRRLPVIMRWVVYGLGVFAIAFWGRYGAAVQQFEYFKF